MTSSEKSPDCSGVKHVVLFVVTVFAAINMGHLTELHVPRDEKRLVNPSKSKGMTEKASKGCSCRNWDVGYKTERTDGWTLRQMFIVFYLWFV
jgi:hypothetical protein